MEATLGLRSCDAICHPGYSDKTGTSGSRGPVEWSDSVSSGPSWGMAYISSLKGYDDEDRMGWGDLRRWLLC